LAWRGFPSELVALEGTYARLRITPMMGRHPPASALGLAQLGVAARVNAVDDYGYSP